jgi:hypothetical protein
MSGGKKRQTMAKQARERAVREKRTLKRERKREAAHLRLADEEPLDVPPEDDAEPGLRLVTEEPMPAAASTGDVEPDEGELRGIHP